MKDDTSLPDRFASEDPLSSIPSCIDMIERCDNVTRRTLECVSLGVIPSGVWRMATQIFTQNVLNEPLKSEVALRSAAYEADLINGKRVRAQDIAEEHDLPSPTLVAWRWAAAAATLPSIALLTSEATLMNHGTAAVAVAAIIGSVAAIGHRRQISFLNLAADIAVDTRETLEAKQYAERKLRKLMAQPSSSGPRP